MSLDSKHLRSVLEIHADPELAIRMKHYMRNQFEYYGIPSPKRKVIVKEIFHSYKLQDKDEFIQFIENCWSEPQREYKYIAIDLCMRQIKLMDSSYIPFYEKLIPKDAWWDTVDGLAPQIIGKILLRNIELRTEYCEKWIESTNFWFQRAAIIVQLMHRDRTDFELLKKLILRRADSKEFFIRKASGWALRQYSKIDPEAVKIFISSNSLSPLTVREGMKRI